MARTGTMKRVALALPIGWPHLELHVHGVLRYAADCGSWTIEVSPESPSISVSSLRGWSGNGIITMINSATDARLVKDLGIPAVNISGATTHSPIPRVTVDNRAVGRLAAEHLLEAGFRRFAYYGVQDLWYSEERGAGFSERVKAVGAECAAFLAPNTLGKHVAWVHVGQPLCKWIQSLAMPVGLLACTDYRARMALEACKRLGVNVPSDMALLGVNNDASACDFCDPPLSSVARNAERVGYEAAALLDRLMRGKPPPSGDLLVPPEGVIQRRSTDVIAIDDPEVAAAVRYMRDHLAESITIDDVAREQGVSRRWLEHSFRRAMRRTPHVYVNFLRIRRARQLIAEDPKITLGAIAKTCGFSDVKRLRAAFARFVGVSLAEYRRAHRKKDDRV